MYERAKAALDEGVKILQLRCKGLDDCDFLILAKKLKKLAHKNKALFIINDRPDIALLTDADGVHLGQKDIAIACARRILGPDKIIGRSTHNIVQALRAQKERADYIGYGPIFKTGTKPALKPIGINSIKSLSARMNIPFFVLGGINQGNIGRIIACGAKRIAVSQAILSCKNSGVAAKKLQKFLKAK